jgi:hopanoid biosynthesis associated protein HpnK
MVAKASGLIITADDFGLHSRVNRAVERAHRHGVLTAASLMVGAPAAADAVARARGLPQLRVGLHLVLTDGNAMMTRAAIPALLDEHGRFRNNMAREGMSFFFLPHVRKQLALEIRAQFDAFARTGLTLDHVNTHKHFHLHPTVLGLILNIGRDYGMHSMRLPSEAGAPLWLKPWIAVVRARLKREGIAYNDHVIGIARSGQMDEAAMLAALKALPRGVVEVYCHPAMEGDVPLSHGMQFYRHADELDALLSPSVAAAIRAAGVCVGGFSDVVGMQQQKFSS